MRYYRPAYFDAFRCIASRCPDSCCKEWDVAVDEASTAAYRALPGALGDRLREVLYDEDDSAYMTIVDGRCPMWRADGLCRIQAELGESALCHTCREFPRLRHDYGDFVELGLELSCPEAAKFLLTAPGAPFLMEETPEKGDAAYDREAMEILLSTRAAALDLLGEARPTGELLALLLLYGCEAQSLLDGGEELPFDGKSALEAAKSMAKPGDMQDILDFFKGLELLTPDWEALLNRPRPGPWDPHTPALARYLVERYWLQAVSDYDLYCRVKLVVIACLLVKCLGGDIFRTAQLFSKEIENDADNVEALLDGAYSHRAFTDDKLLGMLLER